MEKNELRNLRIILVIFAILGPLSAYSSSTNEAHLYNPMWVRVAISIFYAFYFVGTLYVDFIKENSRKITLAIIYFLTFYQIYLSIENNFNASFINGYVFMAILGILYIKSYRQVFIYSVLTFVFLVLLYLSLKDTEFPIRGGSVIGMGITNLLFTMLKVYILNKEFSAMKYSKELKNSEEKYRNLLESAPDAIVSVNSEGNIQGMNRRSTLLFMHLEKDLVGKNIETIIPEEYGINTFLEQIVQNENIQRKELGFLEEIYAVKKNGETFPVELSLSSVVEGDEKHIIIIIRDISRRLRAEKELDQMKLTLQEKELAEKVSVAKSEFISKMSHEIRTPLNGIYGFTNILLKENISPEHKKYIENIKFSSELLNVLINDILDNTNLETGNITLENNEIDIQKLTENVLETFRIRLKEKNISTKINYSESISKNKIIAIGDFLRISQIIMNLLSNAIKFSYESSEIEIDTTLTEIGEGKLEFSYTITDFGLGIPEEKMRDIFQPFVQVSSEISKQYGGNGLGLSIVKHLIDKMGGEIYATSEEKTSFTFKIPLEKAKNLNSTAVLPEEMVYNFPEDMKVLVVEDNLMNQFLVKTILENRKLKHEIVENGKQALVKLADEEFDVILMDLMMPEMDGITCTKIIREELKLDVRIIALTADVKPSVNSEIDELFDGYIKKPFEEVELMNTISKLTFSVNPKS